MMTILDSATAVHFIGIGGSGVSAIARLMLHRGARVSGSDLHESATLDELRTAGASIFIGHRAGNLPPDVDLVVYTIAAGDENPELVKARELGVACRSYPEALGIVSEGMFTIAVSGTHGKTTTTAMIGKLLQDAGLDPTVIVGSPMLHAKSNLVVGKSKYLVAEACEYRRSFLNLKPNILVITNIDRDHLDYYKDLADIQSAFVELASRLGPRGILIVPTAHPNLAPIVATSVAMVVDYEESARMTNRLKLCLPGAHNQLNAQAAATVGTALKISPQVIKRSLRSFRGTKRRLEYKGHTPEGVVIYDDYGHAPAEVRATLSALRELFPLKHLTVVFQPHLFSRTKLLLGEFAGSFVEADHVIVADIYAAREMEDTSIHAKDLVSAINARTPSRALYMSDFKTIPALLKNGELRTDIFLTLGAGSIGMLADALVLGGIPTMG